MLECVAITHKSGSSFRMALFLSKHKKRSHDNKEAFLSSKDTAVTDQKIGTKTQKYKLRLTVLKLDVS